MKKKIITTILMLLMATTTIVACANENDTSTSRSESRKKSDKNDKSDKNSNNAIENNKNAGGECLIGVACLYYDEGEYTDDCNNTYNYKYNLPQIVGSDTAYINSVNEELNNILTGMIDAENSDMEKGISLYIISIDYDFWSGKAGSSIILTIKYDYDYTEYLVYSFDNNGNELTNEDILEAEGIDKNAFISKVVETIYDETYSDIDSSDEMWAECISAEFDGFSLDSIDIFYNENGDLKYVAPINVPAGAGTYYRTFDYK